MAECEALRNIRHRNLIRVLTSCSSVDFEGNDFKALVYEYLPNGNLDEWLHPLEEEQEFESKNLNLIQRLSIAIDVASALDYLHQHCEIPVVHCDLKPSNVLLDDDMTAHVGDFGLARLLLDFMTESSARSTSSLGLRGSIGYVAPEYGAANRVSTEGDVYSYGILLLETFTGKRPTGDSFQEDLSICKYVEMALPGQLEDIVDARLFLNMEGTKANSHTQTVDYAREGFMECIASVLRIGLSCCRELPTERMQMGDVCRELHAIKQAL